ncbi:hypothetical protein Q5752_004446 [Cryptotrichosporon argae]
MLPHIAPLALAAAAAAAPSRKTARESCAITDFDDVDDVVSACTSITLGPLTVPSGETLDLSGLADGTTVTLAGNVTFSSGTAWDGPLFEIGGSDITFDGAGLVFDGNGQDYWDGEGSNGGTTKPHFLQVNMGGTFKDLYVLNAPVQCFSISSDYALTISGVTVDNRAGDALDSSGVTLGHNTDCFDAAPYASLVITGSTCYNQDDCLAINSGQDITFSDNYCSGGHGISIAVGTDETASDVLISGNTVVNSVNGLRIKTTYDATDGSVSNVTYTDNTVTNATTYGVVIEQDYENGSPTGTATSGITITGVAFTGTNTVDVADGADEVYVLCGDGSCTGTWDWSGLCVSGGDEGSVSGDPPIEGFTLGESCTSTSTDVDVAVVSSASGASGVSTAASTGAATASVTVSSDSMPTASVTAWSEGTTTASVSYTSSAIGTTASSSLATGCAA